MARRRRGVRGRGGALRVLERSGINRGLLGGGGKGWVYVGTGLWTLRTVRRMAERKPEVLISEEIQPGQRIVIANDRATLDGVEAPPLRGRAARRARRKG